MSNVIHVEFGKRNVLQEVPDSLTAYLDSLREQGVDDEDILEVIDAINNVDAYFAADDEVKTFADGWLQKFI
jgi:tRNA(Phe) wybutosine-synthesizing methylase Tyw3